MRRLPFQQKIGSGLTLEKVRAAGCAVDLGPLEPRFPELLRTEGLDRGVFEVIKRR